MGRRLAALTGWMVAATPVLVGQAAVLTSALLRVVIAVHVAAGSIRAGGIPAC
ncbi:MAG: hypothetical protein ACYC1E_02565 [Propionibacteriaceae bacterium]